MAGKYVYRGVIIVNDTELQCEQSSLTPRQHPALVAFQATSSWMWLGDEIMNTVIAVSNSKIIHSSTTIAMLATRPILDHRL